MMRQQVAGRVVGSPGMAIRGIAMPEVPQELDQALDMQS